MPYSQFQWPTKTRKKPKGVFTGHALDLSNIELFNKGVTARRNKKPLYANPHIGGAARLWTAGWKANVMKEDYPVPYPTAPKTDSEHPKRRYVRSERKKGR